MACSGFRDEGEILVGMAGLKNLFGDPLSTVSTVFYMNMILPRFNKELKNH